MICYEDLVKDPLGNINRILAMLGEEAKSLPLIGDNKIVLRSGHSSSGNPGRYRSGLVELHVDSAWMSEMKKADEMVVNALTWPLLIRYGYEIRNHPA